MREMIFRGKRKDNGEWVYGDLRQYLDLPLGSEDFCVIDTMPTTSGCFGESYNVVIDTIGQYTGLLDKNGNKIFEGDIVRYTVGYDYGGLALPPETKEDYARLHGKHTKIEQVVYREGEFTPRPNIMDTSTDEIEYSYNFEVIGNIHDNPELLK